MKKTITLLALLALAQTATAAEYVRCQGRLIEPGTSKYDLEKYCGKPDDVSILGTKKSGSKFNSVELNIEEWRYGSLAYGRDYVITVTGNYVSIVKKLD